MGSVWLFETKSQVNCTNSASFPGPFLHVVEFPLVCVRVSGGGWRERILRSGVDESKYPVGGNVLSLAIVVSMVAPFRGFGVLFTDLTF